MKRAFLIFLFASLMIINCGCQEISISITNNEQEIRAGETLTADTTVTPSIAPTVTPYLPAQTSPKPDGNGKLNPEDFFFPEKLLPENTSFHTTNCIYNVTNLNSPGDLSGIAHVRSYYTETYSITIEEVIVESPVPASPENLKVGRHGGEFSVDTSEDALGDYAMVFTSTDHGAITYHYHFYKGDTIILLSLGGFDAYVSKENTYMLAKAIEERLPDEDAEFKGINVLSLDAHYELFDEYFHAFQFMSCDDPDYPLDAIPVHANFFCYSASIIQQINDFKIGIYADQYEEMIYVRKFTSPLPQGPSFLHFFHAMWGFAWHELPAGDYQTLIWVNGKLVKSIPFTLTNDY